MAVFNSALDLIGHTPLVDVSVLSPNSKVRILAKLEGQNPGGSIKDRIALSMIEAAERDGRLKPGSILMEPSSGNTGIGLALICILKGYTLKIVLPANVTPERRQMLEVYGAEIIESPGSEGSNGAVKMAQRLAEENPEWVFLYQYGNPNNPAAHFATTGPEIWADCPEITHFVAGLGTSGTLVGVGSYLKQQNPNVQIWAVEPPSGEMVDGLRNLDDGYIPPIFTDNDGFELLDRKKVIGPRESIEVTRRLVREAGIFAGISSGAIMAAAIKCAAEIEEGVIVSIVCDGGWKYLSTGAYTDDLDEVTERAKKVIYF
jgi:[CysO sulfur-carrier protein]-thiocarboxylate-dependent cysteine synthase